MRTYVDFQVIKDVFLRNMVCDIILKNKKNFTQTYLIKH
jgi:hypothetical protein